MGYDMIVGGTSSSWFWFRSYWTECNGRYGVRAYLVAESECESASEFGSRSRSGFESKSLLTMLTGGSNGLHRFHIPGKGGRIPSAAF